MVKNAHTGELTPRFMHLDYMKLAVNIMVVSLNIFGCRPTGTQRPFGVRWLRQFTGPLAMPAAAFASGFVYHVVRPPHPTPWVGAKCLRSVSPRRPEFSRRGGRLNALAAVSALSALSTS